MKCSNGYQRSESQFGTKTPKLLSWERHVHYIKQAVNQRMCTEPPHAGTLASCNIFEHVKLK